MAPHYFPFDASQTILEPWATDYVPDQAHATQSGSCQFGCPGEEKNDDFINFMPELALPTQWWFPEDDGAGWNGAYSESQYSPSPPFESTDIDLPIDGDPTPSASTSSTATGSPSHLWDSLTPPECNTTYPGIDSAMYMDGSSTEFMTTGIESSTGFSWADNAAFEPHVMSHQSASTQSQRVRRFSSNDLFKHPVADLARRDGENRRPQVGPTERFSRPLHSSHVARRTSGTLESPNWLPT